ncbi:RNA polymerase, sigma-24 subunit, ECF subfamily [Leadbetterella byssophila DSM 17132]|uniref:RNA polymerase sigma factor n=1 Tax=Leadbetterella byssophila (strain DSM 17132 / JCM 16389 / KACC 11308 / NBRC 106382 / 4M15) TaxID=649349 RepID=E4RS18_LEAB4|nr:RNA polymerase sigma factor [Leadbetterella byssophila]ADQ15834.1 RNA polymerase, sigma-24 subunit, ECF subfamily [Leadbetterella byssophila DSM 17132]
MRFFSTKDDTTRLVELCRNGNSRAQYELYQRYSKAMFNTALRIVGNREEAEDVLQDSFLDGFLKIENFRGESTFGAWLKSIVVNKSIARLRNQRIHWEDLDGKENFEEGEDVDFEETEETIERIKVILTELPSGYRVVLNLYLFEGYDHREIGNILGISEVTSRSQFIRAKQKLVELYKKRR